MFENSKAYSGFAVKDIEKTKQFYGETLGLKISELDVGAPLPLLELHPGGDRPVLIYEKGDLTPANYTILNFPVDDVDAAVDQLPRRAWSSSVTRASTRTRRGSIAAGPPAASPGSRIRRATSSPCTARCRRDAGAAKLNGRARP